MIKGLGMYGSIGGSQKFKYSKERPVTNAKIGDVVFNSLPGPNVFAGWMFTEFGWLGFGMLEEVKSAPFMLSDNTQFLVSSADGSGTPFLYRQ